MEVSFVVDPWLFAGSMVCEQAHKNTIEPSMRFSHPIRIPSLFLMAHILSSDTPNNHKHDLGCLYKALIKIAGIREYLKR
jgi:hypothetical protein